MDREKVIKGWECHMEADTLGCADCPYRQGWRTCNFADTLFKDVYSLLKEQDEKEGHWIVLKFCANEGIYCSKCMNKIFDRSTKPKKKLSNYCPNCGSKNTHFFNPSTEKIMYSD